MHASNPGLQHIPGLGQHEAEPTNQSPKARQAVFFLLPRSFPLSTAHAPMSTPPSASLRGFLDAHFASPDDLAAAPALAELLRRECAELDSSLRRLEAQLRIAAASWLARSTGARSDLRHIRPTGSFPRSLARSLPSVINPTDIGFWFRSAADPPRVPCCSPLLGGAVDAEDEGAETVRKLGLPALVREIQRIDTIRLYAGQRFFLSSSFSVAPNCNNVSSKSSTAAK